MPSSLKRLGAAGLASFLLFAATGAFAQAKKPAHPAPAAPTQAQPAPAQPAQDQAAPPPQGPVKIDLVPTQNDWFKVCGRDQSNKEICSTTKDFSAKAGEPPVLAMIIYDTKGEDTRTFKLLVPLGFLLRPGFRFTVDKGVELEGSFEVCIPNGCLAEAKVKGGTIDQLKKGSILSVVFKNQGNNEITFAIPVAGFGRAFDGPPIDPKVLEEQQKKYQEEMQKRAEEERKRLDAAKPDAGKPAAPAPPASAPPPK
jgi:invasion protein IalB